MDNEIVEFAAAGQNSTADLPSITIEESADEGIGENELSQTAGGDLNAYLSDQLARVQPEEDESVESVEAVD